MRYYNLARGLLIHTRFDDLDLITRSQIYYSHKLEIVFRFLSTVVEWWMVATHIQKIKHSMLCVTGVYFKDIIDMIFARKRIWKMYSPMHDER